MQLDDDVAFRIGLEGRALSRQPQLIEPFQPPSPPIVADVCGGVEVRLVEWRPERLDVQLLYDPRRCQPHRVAAQVTTDSPREAA